MRLKLNPFRLWQTFQRQRQRRMQRAILNDQIFKYSEQLIS